MGFDVLGLVRTYFIYFPHIGKAFSYEVVNILACLDPLSPAEKISTYIGIAYVGISTIYTTLKLIFFLKSKLGSPLRLEVSHAFLSNNQNLEDSYVLTLEIFHTGSDPIAVQQAGYDLPDGRHIPIVQPRTLPRKLEQGDPQLSEYLNVKKLGQSLKRENGDIPVKGWVKDAQGNKYSTNISKEIRKNLRDFLIREGILPERQNSTWEKFVSFFKF